ncbi:lytic polysaccharide monooxygenase [Brochothrix thermosphacta]|uniref:lytic polysaccharide monooxygenase n=1 Tax=Brochothrix thermosphacta TaxID=2756 RepID=UPI00083F67CA|nr:lytic polysaccharide monooxygenase [Brochothrix thermosphacta]ODJ71163.1 hypothetical protein BFR43_04715 [Brochothrix thermosphacta]
MKKVTFRSASKTLLLATMAAAGLMIVSSQEASAHGYVESPVSRAYQGQLDVSNLGWDGANELYGAAMTQPQGLEAPKGFPINGPADGSIASANGSLGDNKLDIQTSSYWKHQKMSTGVNDFTWHYTAVHNTTKWHYYMTKQGWDQNAPLVRDELELIGTVEHDGSAASNNPTHQVKIPDNRSGYNVILAVWDVADTPNAFYQVIDVDVQKGGETPEAETPNAPTTLTASNVTASSMEVSWKAPSNTDVKEYNVYRDGEKVKTISGTSFADTGLEADTEYTYSVEAVGFDGKTSEMSTEAKFSTNEIPAVDEETPTAPSGVHSMGTTESSVDLMWTKSSHSVGLQGYEIYRDGTKIATTTGTMYKDETVSASTTYSYTIKAISIGGNVSDASEAFVVTTEDSENVVQSEGAWVLGSLDNPVEYKKDQIVTHKGKTYKTITTHINYGDANWAPDIAVTLFEEVDNVWVLGSLDNPVEYKKDQIVTHKGKTYKTITSHLNYGDASWAPDVAITLFEKN